jgi:hypothetical protein
MFLGSVAQIVENDAWLDAGDLVFRVNLDNPVKVLRHVHHNGDVRALTRERGSAAAAKNGRAELSGESHGCNHVLDITGQHYTDWDLPIIRAIGGV